MNAQHKLMRNLAEIQFRDLMNQDSPTQWDLFLSCNVFVEYISIKIAYFHLKYYGLFFFIVKSLTTHNVPYDCPIHEMCCCWTSKLIPIMMSQWVGDII